MDEQEEFEFRYRYEQEQKQTGAVKAPSSTGGRLYGSSYDKYLAEMQERASRPSIPGAEAYDKAKPMSYEEWAKLKDKKHGDRLLSLPDVAMTIGSAPFAAVNAVGGALANKLTGQEDFLPAYERIFNQTMWQPKTDTGEDILNALNPVLGAFPAVGGYVGPLGAMRKAKAKPIPQSKDFAAALQEEAPKSEPVVEAPDLRLEHPIAAENRVAAQNKAVRGADDWNSMEHAARAVDEEIAAMEQLQRQQAEEALAAEQARTHAFLRDAQQTVIDDTPHGDRPAQFGMTDEFGRVDEGVPGIERDATGQMRVVQGSGIPIRADLSIEAQQLQNPLQRNLWGDELGPALGAERSLTEAIDSMPPGPAREQGISQLRGQRGAVDLGNNASGESPASLEALGRLMEERRLDRVRAVIKQDGTVTPLIGVDAVDYRPRPGEVVVQKNVGNTPWTILDSNGVKNPTAQLNRGMSRGQRGALDWGDSRTNDFLNKLNPFSNKARFAKIQQHTGHLAEQMGESFPSMAKFLKRRDIQELINDMVEAEKHADPIQFWQEKLAGVSALEDPTLGGQMQRIGKNTLMGQARGPRDMLELHLTPEQAAEATDFAAAIDQLRSEFMKGKQKAQEPVHPDPSRYTWPKGKDPFFHDERMQNKGYARDYAKFEKQVQEWNAEVARLHAAFAENYGFNPDGFYPSEFREPVDAVWDLIHGVASKMHSDEQAAITKHGLKGFTGGMIRGQRGGFDYELLPKAFRDFVDNWKKAGGNLSHVGVSRMLDDHPVTLSKETRELLASLYPETAKTYQEKIDRAWAQSNPEKAARWGKHYDDALITEAVLKQHDAFGKGFTLDGPRYNSKTGRYAGKVAAQEQADAVINMAKRKGQSGAIDFGEALQKLKVRKQLPSVEDLSIGTPPKAIAPEEAARLNSIADKASAVGMNQYSRISTPEQVMVNPGKDIRPSYTGGRNATVSGVEGMVRLYPQNKLLNFVRTTFQEARNQAEIWSKDFLTGKEGINSHLNKLTQEQKNEVVGLLLEADRQQRPISDTALEKLGFTPEQSLAVKRIRDALDHLYAEKTKALGAQGFDAHTYREGYVPANFGGAYKSLVGHYKDGKWITTGIAQADTLYGLKKAEEWYRQQDGSVEIIRAGTSKLGTGRTGLKQSSGLGRSNDAWANLIAALAKVDPEFAKAKAMADQKGIDATASLYDFQVHELHKKGVTGALGNRPWLDKNTNTKQFIEGLVQYLEDGYRYTAYQKPLTDTMTLISNPELRKTQKNAARYTEQYLEHLKGQGLSPIGAGLNSAVDAIVSGLGLGHGKMQKVAHEISHYSALHMMGFANIGFLGMQLTQLATGGMPEASSIVSQHGLSPSAMPKALNNTMNFLVKLGLDRKMGKPQDLPAHMVEAFDWADSVGMFTFSESELAHQVLQSKLRKKSDKILDASIRYGELATRPTVFLWYADLFNQAGFTGKEALLKAQAATDYAMVNYHPDERPMLYQSLGVMGSLLGALSTYKHNFVTQGVTRSKHAITEPAAFGTFMALGLAMYGLGGFPGYEEVDNKVNEYSGKSIRQWVLDNTQQPSVAIDGWLSAASGLDFQSRLSMSSLFPDSPASMFPHISNISNIFMKGMEFAINPDTGSFQDLALAGAPKSIANALEMSVFEDGNIRSRKTGENKYTTPRTKEEEMVRAITGIKPFRETLEDKSVFQARVVESRRQDKLKAAQQRFDRAFLLDDPAGMDKAAAAYEEHSGDLTTLFDSGRLAKLVEESSKGERARRAGTPSSLNSLKTYETFMGNK